MDIPKETIDQLADNNLYRLLGIKVLEARDGRAVLRLTPDPRTEWPVPGQPHGGILFTLMDTTMAWAVVSDAALGQSCVTIDLNIQYPSPAIGSHFICTAHTLHRTRALTFARAEIHNPEGGLAATGQGTFRIIKADFIPQ